MGSGRTLRAAGMSKSTNNTGKAVIYVRVSGAKQVREGDGLASQEVRCREYAAYKGLSVVQVFKDDMSGKLVTRPGMQAMLAYLRQHKSTVVIIDDISRLARGLDAHLELRASLARAGAKLESPSLEFGEDSDSLLVENLLASVAQHHREKNGEQTRNRMRGRLLNGYWVFQAPIGYRYEKRAGHGKMLVPDEPLASIVREALEGYALGRFETQAEVKRFLEAQPRFPKDLPNGHIRQQKVTDILTRPLYAGYIEAPSWDVPLRRGQHEALISMETFAQIQDRRLGKAKAPARVDLREDFPLRGFVACADCDHPMTSCWSTSSTGVRHPYYMCQSKGCVSYRKSIRRDAIEGAFEEELKALVPQPGMIGIVTAMFRDAWSQREKSAHAQHKDQKAELAALETQIESLLDRIVESNSATVIAAYEKRIEKLEREKLVLEDRVQSGPRSAHSFEDMFERALAFLSSPWKIWKTGNLNMRRTVLRLAFMERMQYCRKKGFRTPQKSIVFKALEGLKHPESEMVRSRRLELPPVLPDSDLNAARLPIPPRPQILARRGLIPNRPHRFKHS